MPASPIPSPSAPRRDSRSRYSSAPNAAIQSGESANDSATLDSLVAVTRALGLSETGDDDRLLVLAIDSDGCYQAVRLLVSFWK